MESIGFLDDSLKITVFNNGQVLLIFKDVRYICTSQFRYNYYNSLQIFVESNIVVLYSGMMFTSFVFENDAFSKIGDYSIGNFICGAILTFVRETPYFVCCIHRSNFPLSLFSIDLITGKKNKVLEMREDDHFDSFEMNDCLSITTTTSCGDLKKSPVNIQKAHETRESWL
jgi:hypothetical protein